MKGTLWSLRSLMDEKEKLNWDSIGCGYRMVPYAPRSPGTILLESSKKNYPGTTNSSASLMFNVQNRTQEDPKHCSTFPGLSEQLSFREHTAISFSFN